VAAGEARERSELDAEALGLSQRYGLGDCTSSWLETSYLVRVITGWIVIVISLIILVAQLSPADYQAGLAQLSGFTCSKAGWRGWRTPGRGGASCSPAVPTREGTGIK
jgi:hypothetical protein